MRFFYLLLVLPWFVACGPQHKKQTLPPLQQGVLDLRAWDFAADGVVPLEGEWNFVWEQFVEPHQPLPKNAHHMSLPRSWNGWISAGQPLSGDGYATFRMTALLPEHPADYALNLPLIVSSYRLYANEKLIAKQGTVGTTIQTTTPQWNHVVSQPFRGRSSVQLTLHVANFHHLRGGPWRTLELGYFQDILQQQDRDIFRDAMIIGVIFFIGLFSMVLFVIAHKSTALFFALFCFSLTVRGLMTESKFVLEWFPVLDWGQAIMANRISVYGATLTFFLFLHARFSNLLPLVFIRFNLGITALVVILTGFSNVKFQTQIMDYYRFYIPVGVSFSLFFLGKAAWRKEAGAAWLLFGVLAVTGLVINDVLHDAEIIQSQYLAPYGQLLLALGLIVDLIHTYLRQEIDVRKKEATFRETLAQTIVQQQRKESELLDRISDALISLNDRHEITFVNRSASLLLGEKASNLKGASVEQLFPQFFQKIDQEELEQYQEMRESLVFKEGVVLQSKALERSQNFVVAIGTFQSDDEEYSLLIVPETQRRTEPENSLEPQQSSSASILPTADDLDNAVHQQIAELMNEVVNYWEHCTGQSKIELAEQSGFWTAQNDKGTYRTRTLDKYLDWHSVPKKPRLKTIDGTVEFVLLRCTQDTPLRKNILKHRDDLLKS